MKKKQILDKMVFWVIKKTMDIGATLSQWFIYLSVTLILVGVFTGVLYWLKG